MVEHRDVARRLIRDDDFVPVLVQLVEHSAHRDDVVIGVRGEHDHAFAGRELAAPADLGDQSVEDGAVEGAGLSVPRQQRAQAVLAVIILIELEHRFAGRLAQPDDGVDLLLAGPLHFAQHPRRSKARQVGRRREVDVENRVRVLLKIGRGDIGVRLSLHRPPNDGGLVLPGRHERDLLRFHDRRHTHRDRFGGHVVLAEEIARGIAACDGVERDATSARIRTGAGLVEPDVAGLSDPEDLKIDSTCISDRSLVRLTFVIDLGTRNIAARDVDVLGTHVDVVEEILPHEPVIAVDAVRLHRVVLVEVEGHDIGEVEAFLAVHLDQLAIDPDGRASSGESEHGVSASPPPLLHYVGDARGDRAGDLSVLDDDEGDSFPGG